MIKQARCIYEFGIFRLDAAKRLLLRDADVVPLTPKCVDILLALVESSGEPLSKDRLIELVWPDSFVEEGNLTYNISILRKALGERAGENQYIITKPGHGYQFVASVRKRWLDPSNETVQETSEFPDDFRRQKATNDPDEIKTVKQPDTVLSYDVQFAERLNAKETENTGSSNSLRRLVFSSVILTMVALIIILGYRLFGPRELKPITTVAVLPFFNASDNPDMDYLSEGISESLINSLSRLAGVKVISRGSSFRYKGKDIDPKDAASELGVEAIVTGRLAQLGDNLVISTELTDARDNTQIWGDHYNRKTMDLLSVQSEISSEIGMKLRSKLTVSEQQQLARQETVNPQAYEMILRGRFHREKGGSENLTKAVEYFNRAISIDPGCAGAYAELSIMYTLLSSRGVLDPKQYIPMAEATARKALALDGNLAEANYALANLETNTWRWAAAAVDFARTLELNPNLDRARFRHAVYLSIMGQSDHAVEEIEHARELNPLSLRFRRNVGLVLLLTRRYDEAIKVLKNSLEMDPRSGEAQAFLGQAYAAKGMYPEAIAALQEAVKLGDDLGVSSQIHLGAAYANAGQREKAQATLKRLQTMREYVSPGLLPVLHIALGEREQAFASLERAYAEHDPQLQYLGLYPGFDPVRADPRFQDLMRRVGLPQ